MTIDLIKVGDNGQLEFDFESLEAVTSAETVEALKHELTSLTIVDYSVNQNDSFVSYHLSTVSKHGYTWFLVLGFSKLFNTFHISKISSFDIESFSKLKIR